MSRALRPVPDTPPRALGMIRVSKDRDGTISPQVQRVAISDYAAARGYEVTGWLEGIDESGSRRRSAWWPRLDQAVAEVETGTYEVIVVWEFSRTARNRLKWNVAIDRVEAAGGRLESATERVDVTTASGRFQRGVLSEMHAYRAEAIGEGWKAAHAARVRSGRPSSGTARFGYVYDTGSKLHVPDPETGPLLFELYRRYVAGESFYALVRWLNGHGWRTTAGGLWSDRALRRVLDSGFASGRFLVHGEMHAGAHEALVDEQLWQAYLDARGSRRARPARVEGSRYLLSGLVRCGRCEGPMTGTVSGRSRDPQFRCAARRERGPEACEGGSVLARFVEAEVLVFLNDLAGQVEAGSHAAAASAARRVSVRSESERLAREAGRVEEALTRLAVQHAADPLPETVYRRARVELGERGAVLGEALEEARRAERRVVADPSVTAAGLLEHWSVWPVFQRREVLRGLVREVRVWSGRPPRIAIVPAWEGVE